ncbi:MAG: sn-glycerol-3-phosphate ABC transporter ATP-binding protein UgpC [Acidimicrobiales bacterium]
MAAINLRNIVKRYGDGFPAVNDVSLDIADGEFMILVGPSGCGKSTLLRMIVGLEDITSGELLIGGQRVNEMAPRQRNLAMVFQNYALYPHLSVFENIAFPLRLRGGDPEEEVRRKVTAAAETLELTEHLDRKPSNLSGGQRQRVAMGRAIVRNADAFLFDEPLSNLDAKLRGQMRTEILRLQRRLGVTTVYVTHDQTEAMTLGDRVAVLRKGSLQQVASPRELYEQPVNMFVAGFIGSPPMNFVPAPVQAGELVLPFVRVPLDAAMRAAVGDRDLIMVGVRPERFEDASLVDADKAGVRFRTRVDVIEWLGNEQYAYVPYDVPTGTDRQLQELARELDSEHLRNQLVVALDPQSRIRGGEEAELWFDTRRMHLFDPATGDNLYSSGGAVVPDVSESGTAGSTSRK